MEAQNMTIPGVEPEPMRIIELAAENIKRLKAVSIKPTGAMVQITGKNEAGKTSTIDSILYALGGGRALPTKPLRKGASKGKVSVNLGRFKATRTFTAAGGGTLKVETAEGYSVPKGQTLLDSFLNDFAFRPREFAEADPVKQREMLLAVSEIPREEDKLTELIKGTSTGLDGDPLQILDTAESVIYETRVDVGRERKSHKAAAEAINVPAGYEDAKPVDLKVLYGEKEKLQAQAQANKEDRDALQALKSQRGQQANFITTLENDLAELLRKVEAKKQDIATAKENLADTDGTIKAQEGLIANLEEPDFADIEKRIAEADTTNEIAQQAKRRQEEEALADQADQEYKAYTEKIDAIKEYRASLLERAKLPMDNLGLEDGYVTLDGVPISQRGRSKRILAGLAICAALNPKLRIALIRDGNDFDEDNLRLMEEWAEANDYQLWIQRINGTGPDSFLIVDGELKE